jgi:hypothetical protein
MWMWWVETNWRSFCGAANFIRNGGPMNFTNCLATLVFFPVSVSPHHQLLFVLLPHCIMAVDDMGGYPTLCEPAVTGGEYERITLPHQKRPPLHDYD